MNQFRKIASTFLAFTAFASMAFGQGNMNLSLSQAKEYAIKNSYTVKASKLDLENAKKKIYETTAIGLPQVSGSVAYQNIFTVPELQMTGFYLPAQAAAMPVNTIADLLPFQGTASIPLGVKENTTYTLTASQIIFSGEYIVGLQASRIFYQLSEQNLQKSERDIEELAAKSYYLVLVLEENFKIVNESFKIIDKTYNDIKAMHAQGLIEETDVDQMFITRSTIENAVRTIENQMSIANRLLKFQLGLPFEQNVVLTDSLPTFLSATPQLSLGNTNVSVANNIDYKLMKSNERLQELSLNQQQSKVLPSIVAVYRFQKLQNEPAFNFTPKNVLAIQVDVPIFASGARYMRIQEAKITLEKTRIQLEQVEQGLKLEIERANADYINAYNNFRVLEQNMELTKKIYDRTLIKYSTGIASSFDLNTAQTQYLNTLTNYYNSIITLLNAKQTLEKLSK